MSTATLLLLATRLRQTAQSDGYRHPVSARSSIGGSRTGRGAAAMIHAIQHIKAGRKPFATLLCRRFHPLAFAGACSPFSGARVFAAARLVALLAFALPLQTVVAQQSGEVDAQPEDTRRIGGAPPGPCVQVDIAGHRSGHLNCATGRLQAAANSAQTQARAGIDAPVIGAGSPDIQTGIAHEGATRLRMGNALGRSIYPERPNRPIAPPRGSRP